MITYDKAIEIVNEVVPLCGVEQVPLLEAVGRVVSEDLVSTCNFPAFANSAMDGFAVFSEDTLGATSNSPVMLSRVGSVAAGDIKSENFCKHGQATEIMTGAVMPEGFDAVVRVEDTSIASLKDNNSHSVQICKEVLPQENVRSVGEDFKVGTKLVKKGSRLSSQDVMIYATLGVRVVDVRRRPRIAIVSTGNELVDLRQGGKRELSRGQIYNSTAPFLLSYLATYGADVNYCGVAVDDQRAFLGLIENVLAEQPDLVITTGAVSMGRHDFVPQALEDLGAEILFHKVAIRPGKPVLFAKNDNCLFMGLPGNPLSVVACNRFFVVPCLDRMMGVGSQFGFEATLTEDVDKPSKLQRFFLGNVNFTAEGLEFTPKERQLSFMVSPLLGCNVWGQLPEGVEGAKRGEKITCHWFNPFRLN